MPTEDTVNIGARARNQAPPTVKASTAEPNTPAADAARKAVERAHEMLPTCVLAVSPGAATPTPVPRVSTPLIPGYEVKRELARGGMGLVLEARDPRLGRDVAIKVLLPGYKFSDAAPRFVQESKITARLPHPGIPPVYELGELPDGNPFLAMKLVRGRTLAAELADADHTADLSRSVRIFEQIAQVVGFAHSQNVIHRDLKPANVMVGTFGEVQVMDWGIAKEVGEPEGGVVAEPAIAGRRDEDDPVQTKAGLALGTPSYMAPEQARGERLGPPADVFALGGILCDILTGHPPFEGDTTYDTLRRAARGDVATAFARLDSCIADPELVALCKRLLSPQAADRPADGKVVADAVAAYRTGVERRLRNAETERAAAEARAAEQRKKRRVQLALSATLVALVGLVGLGAWWQDRQVAHQQLDEERRQQAERERVARNATALDDMLTRCEEALRQGDADRAGELLRQAEARSTDGGAGADDRLTRLRVELALLKELGRVQDLDWAIVKGESVSPDQLVAAWSEVFRALGFAAGSPPSEEVTNRIRKAIVREQILGALESWFWTRPSADVLVLLQSADPDRYRDAVRAARRDENAARLSELAGSPDVLRQPARFALLFARHDSVPPARRDQILQALHHQQPNDLQTLMDLATVRPDERPEHTAERVGWYRAAIAVRPRNTAAWNNLANALHTLGQSPAAIIAYREAIRLDPTFVAAHSNLGNALRDVNDLPGALAVYRGAVRLDPKYAPGHNNLASALQDSGDLPGAIAAFKEAIRLKPDFVIAYANLAAALCSSGDPQAAIAACREAIRIKPMDATSHAHLGNALRQTGDLNGAIGAYKESIRLGPKRSRTHCDLGTVLRLRGDLPGAVAAQREAVRLDPAFAAAYFELGSALREIGDLTGSLAAYREAVRLDPDVAPAHHNLGLTLKAAGDVPGALAAFREAIRRDPRLAPAHNSLGLVLRATGDLKGAITAYRESIRVDPKYIPSYNNLGVALRMSGDLQGAIAVYKEAIRIEPRDGFASHNLGLVLTAMGDTPGAIGVYRHAIKHNPDLFPIHASLALLLQASGDRPGAIAAYREMIRLNPRHAGTHAALGMALLESGDTEAARAVLAKAAELDPRQFGPLFRSRFLPIAPPPREMKPTGSPVGF